MSQRTYYFALHNLTTYIFYLPSQVCRCLDQFVEGVAAQNVSNKTIELRGKNGFKLFPNGISHILRNGISVDGAFHISMARHLHVYLCTLDGLPTMMKQRIGRAYELLFQVHQNLRLPVHKTAIQEYQNTIDSLLVMVKIIYRPFSKTNCNSIKFHYPIHWGDTRVELGCAADEKSLERKLGESQKRHFKFTNRKFDVDGSMVCKCYIV
jgi:hypothetical protein